MLKPKPEPPLGGASAPQGYVPAALRKDHLPFLTEKPSMVRDYTYFSKWSRFKPKGERIYTIFMYTVVAATFIRGVLFDESYDEIIGRDHCFTDVSP